MKRVPRSKHISIYATTLALILALTNPPASHADTISLIVATEHDTGYQRSLFKLWIDADGNGCNTRKEVLIAEAIVKPAITGTCTLVGGKWTDVYDNVQYTDSAKLDIDHLVPLDEAWRSGAWRWTAQQREDYANDITDSRALIAVGASINREKSDKDIAHWLPPLNVCTYVTNYIAIKIRYSLSFDSLEAERAKYYINKCPIGAITVDVLPGYSNPDVKNQVSVSDKSSVTIKKPTSKTKRSPSKASK